MVVTRATAAVGFLMLTMTLFGLADDPVLAHVTLFGMTSALFVTGAGPWSFDERPEIAFPSFQERLSAPADRPDEFQHTTVKYSYSFLRTDGKRRFAVDATDWPVTKLGESEAHVTDRLDVLVAKLSRDLSDDGHPVFTVSDGSERERHFAVLVNETSLNRPLREANYGDLLFVERALVLWNDDQDAVNLVVDEETVVDPA